MYAQCIQVQLNVCHLFNWTQKRVWQVIVYFYAKAMSVGDTMVVIRNASVLPHSCPLQSIGTVNSIGLTADDKIAFVKYFVMLQVVIK